MEYSEHVSLNNNVIPRKVLIETIQFVTKE